MLVWGGAPDFLACDSSSVVRASCVVLSGPKGPVTTGGDEAKARSPVAVVARGSDVWKREFMRQRKMARLKEKFSSQPNLERIGQAVC